MSQRFFCENLATGTQVVLAGDEGRHLATVMRARVGEEITLFDGSGAEFVARIVEIRKGAVTLEVVERRAISRELPLMLTLAVALPRGERQKWLVEKATELGVTRLVPLATERGVAVPGDAAVERLARQVIEASKQCGRNRLMEIGQPVAATELFAAADRSVMRIVADSTGQPVGTAGQVFNLPGYAASAGCKPDPPEPAASREWLIAVGPEGGFTGAELDAARGAGWQAVSLGPRILRVETAALALAAWVALSGEGFEPADRGGAGF